MNWERKALEKIILLLAEKDREFYELSCMLSKFKIETNFNGAAYDI
jgi:hypothetical protein